MVSTRPSIACSSSVFAAPVERSRSASSANRRKTYRWRPWPGGGHGPRYPVAPKSFCPSYGAGSPSPSPVRRQRLHLNTPLPELRKRLRFRAHPPVRARAHHQPLGQLLDHIVEIGKYEFVPVRAPPAGEHPIGEHDHVARLLLTVDDDMAEAVSLDSGHRLTSHLRGAEVLGHRATSL